MFELCLQERMKEYIANKEVMHMDGSTQRDSVFSMAKPSSSCKQTVSPLHV